MREMVLNHASIAADNRYSAIQWLIGLAEGVRTIRDVGLATTHLWASKQLYEIQCTEEANLYELTIAMLSSTAKEQAALLMELSARVSLLKSPNPDKAAGRAGISIGTSSNIALSAEDADPLRYCVKTDGIAVGFPSDPLWDRDTVDVLFNEISPDGDEIGDATDTIDNLTRPEHAIAILERHRTHLRHTIANFEELWEQRESAFPNLVFGPDVEDQLQEINPGDLSAIVKKLSMIDQSAARWQVTDSAMPEWNGNVTPESNSVRNNPALISARRFRSNSGSTKIFEWHTRFGNAGRIHLRFDASTKLVEIGYIGKHLPLPP